MVSSEAPGLKRKPNKDGTRRHYWEARTDLVKRGYRPKLVPLHDPDTEDGRRQMAARCRVLQAEMLAWQANDGAFKPRAYDGTIGALCRQFVTDPESPYRDCKYNTQLKYDKDTKIVIATVGGRRVDSLLGPDFRRWHANWGAPKDADSPPRPWRAKHCMDSTRRVIAYGVTLGFDDCIRADTILGKMEFRQPAARHEKMTFEHVGAIRRTAHLAGLPSVALATVFQFELSLRQKDVIGEWIPEPETQGGIIFRGRQWRNGLTWSDIRPDGYLQKVHTKTGVTVEWNLTLYPAVLEELALVPPIRRVGPLIISESTGQPYKAGKFSEAFRRVANQAGIPSTVWSMDARAGAITEAYDAGAAETDVMKHAGHKNRQTSARYNRGSLKQTERVAVLRHEKRGGNEG